MSQPVIVSTAAISGAFTARRRISTGTSRGSPPARNRRSQSASGSCQRAATAKFASTIVTVTTTKTPKRWTRDGCMAARSGCGIAMRSGST